MEHSSHHNPPVAVVMGSKSDWQTMQHAVKTLMFFGIRCSAQVISAHRMPNEMFDFAQTSTAQVIIAGAGGSAHLPGMIAAKTLIPVLGVPIQSQALQGVDSLLSIVQMPAGTPVATFSIGIPGAVNAALFAIRLMNHSGQYTSALNAYHEEQKLLAKHSILSLPNDCEQ